jgi:hypothetical protein
MTMPSDDRGFDGRGREAPRASNLERHVQTLVGAAILAAILWVGGTVTGNRERIATLEERLINLKELARGIEDTLNERAANVHNVTNLERRVDVIERRLEQAQERLIIPE